MVPTRCPINCFVIFIFTGKQKGLTWFRVHSQSPRRGYKGPWSPATQIVVPRPSTVALASPGSLLEYRTSGLSPVLLNENLHLNKIDPTRNPLRGGDRSSVSHLTLTRRKQVNGATSPPPRGHLRGGVPRHQMAPCTLMNALCLPRCVCSHDRPDPRLGERTRPQSGELTLGMFCK